MRDWIEDLSDWMEKKEKISFQPSSEISEEVNQMLQETHSLLQASDHLNSVYSQIIGNTHYDNS